ncbi:MAG: hypothetical protein LBH59_11820, partial [Planctomycetaceae bacterium]|nr:hypothetical protein [Planctomycetaceae bacterium]
PTAGRFDRGGQVGRSGFATSRSQRNPRTSDPQSTSASSTAGHADRPPRDGAARSTFSDQNSRRFSDRNRGQDRFNRNRTIDSGEKRPKSYVSTPKAKELKPITEKMKQGKEPLRSFGDLAQLWGRVQVSDPAEKKQKNKTKEKTTKEIETENNNKTEQT